FFGASAARDGTPTAADRQTRAAAAASRRRLMGSLRSAPGGVASGALHGDALRGEDVVLEREHAGRGLVDLARERDRAGEDRRELLLVLDAGLRVLVLDHEVRVRDVERQQLAGRGLVVEPVHR